MAVQRTVGGNKGKLLSFHYARYQGPRETFINKLSKEANLSVSLRQPLRRPRTALDHSPSYPSLFNPRSRQRRLFGSLEIPLRILLLGRVCVTVISVATLSRLSGAFPPPNSRPSRWSLEGELAGGLDISSCP